MISIMLQSLYGKIYAYQRAKLIVKTIGDGSFFVPNTGTYIVIKPWKSWHMTI